jgi:hypothetical protein
MKYGKRATSTKGNKMTTYNITERITIIHASGIESIVRTDYWATVNAEHFTRFTRSHLAATGETSWERKGTEVILNRYLVLAEAA